MWRKREKSRDEKRVDLGGIEWGIKGMERMKQRGKTLNDAALLWNVSDVCQLMPQVSNVVDVREIQHGESDADICTQFCGQPTGSPA